MKRIENVTMFILCLLNVPCIYAETYYVSRFDKPK